jgi:hypothetical protein
LDAAREGVDGRATRDHDVGSRRAFRLMMVQQVHKHSRLNRRFMTPGVACRCFHCLHAFLAEQIAHWIDDDKTALCPLCGIDSVLSNNIDTLSDTLIQQLHAAYFGSSRKYTDAEWRRDLAEEQRHQRGAIVGGE